MNFMEQSPLDTGNHIANQDTLPHSSLAIRLNATDSLTYTRIDSLRQKAQCGSVSEHLY
jgi:hypothetical protein